jgi:hypothetical protein
MVGLGRFDSHNQKESMEGRQFGCRSQKEWTVEVEPFGWWFHSLMVG